MVRARPTLPAGHGELLLRPESSQWAAMAALNAEKAQGWRFEVAGMPAVELRRLARGEIIAGADAFSARLGVRVATPRSSDSPIVMTGHQPELYHPGVWVKDFLLQRFSDEIGGTGIDVVVDSDGFDSVVLTSPCLAPVVRRCRQYLAVGTETSCFACSPAPSSHDIDLFCRAGEAQLAALPAPSIRRHFAEFCEALRSAERDAGNLAELVTFARRRYEASAGTDYLELPVSSMARTASFARFVADLAFDAARFASDYNHELEVFRAFTKTRSKAQPFPDLEADDSAVELPLWALQAGMRETVWAVRKDRDVSLVAGDRVVAALGSDLEEGLSALLAAPAVIAPKALALTLFIRLFCCDFFIHGVGGGRYDAVTDAVCRRFYGVEPPAFAVASMTMYLPLGAHVVTDDEVSRARERINRLDHNPDQVLDEVEFESAEERARARALGEEKRALVEAITARNADKKELGSRIREVNSSLADLLGPLREQWSDELASLESQRQASEVFSDRGYPFCFWSPSEIADKVW